jgi:hypothetical protein
MNKARLEGVLESAAIYDRCLDCTAYKVLDLAECVAFVIEPQVEVSTSHTEGFDHTIEFFELGSESIEVAIDANALDAELFA